MAKKKPVRRTTTANPLPGMESEFKYPPKVKKAVKKYTEALTEKGKASAVVNTAKDNAIEEMEEAGLERVRYQDTSGNWKFLELEKKSNLKIKTPKQETEEE